MGPPLGRPTARTRPPSDQQPGGCCPLAPERPNPAPHHHRLCRPCCGCRWPRWGQLGETMATWRSGHYVISIICQYLPLATGRRHAAGGLSGRLNLVPGRPRCGSARLTAIAAVRANKWWLALNGLSSERALLYPAGRPDRRTDGRSDKQRNSNDSHDDDHRQGETEI